MVRVRVSIVVAARAISDHAAGLALRADLAPADDARGGRRAVAHQVGAELAEGAVDAVVADLLLNTVVVE
jgi:hypothetical protein